MTPRPHQSDENTHRAEPVIFVVEPNGIIHREFAAASPCSTPCRRPSAARGLAGLATGLLLCATFVWWVNFKPEPKPTPFNALSYTAMGNPSPALQPSSRNAKANEWAVKSTPNEDDDERVPDEQDNPGVIVSMAGSPPIPIVFPVLGQPLSDELADFLKNQRPRGPPQNGTSSTGSPKPSGPPDSPSSPTVVSPPDPRREAVRRTDAHANEIKKIGILLQGGAVSTPIPRLVPCPPGFDEKDWVRRPLPERVRLDYLFKELAVPGSGESFLAKLVQEINGYESVRFNPKLQELGKRSGQQPIQPPPGVSGSFINHPSPQPIPSLQPNIFLTPGPAFIPAQPPTVLRIGS